MVLLLLFLFISILFSFLCSILEAVLLSITPSYTRRATEAGGLTGKLLEEYKKDIDRPLSAILTLNTIAHTVGAIGVGAQAGKLYGSQAINVGVTTISYEGIIATLMTLAILIFSEIIPKTLGANNWKTLAPFTVRALRIMLLILAPLVWLSQIITGTLKKEDGKSVLSRADLSAMAGAGEESGALRREESAVIRNLLGFEQLTVRDIMTPKTVILMVHEKETLFNFSRKQVPIPFSRIPVYSETRDQVTGILLKDELLQFVAEGKGDDLAGDHKREVNFVLDKTPLTSLFKTITQQRTHLSIVVDEYGSVAGLVTQEDLFETLLGMEITDEMDTVEDLQKLARKIWEQRTRGKFSSIKKNNE
jgi:CBS domain containing-hemolysin-like protein